MAVQNAGLFIPFRSTIVCVPKEGGSPFTVKIAGRSRCRHQAMWRSLLALE